MRNELTQNLTWLACPAELPLKPCFAPMHCSYCHLFQFSVINLTKQKKCFSYTQWRTKRLFYYFTEWTLSCEGWRKWVKWKKEWGKKLRNISNFVVIAFSVDDYDSYHFWFTSFWSVHFIKKIEIFSNSLDHFRARVRKYSIRVGLGNLFKKS